MKRSSLIFLRFVLGILILLNMGVIFAFSAQNREESGKASGVVAEKVAELTVPDFSHKPEPEQATIVNSIHNPLRKMAHMTEFGSLGLLCFLFLLTWKGHGWLRFLASLLFTFCYAATDEWHQSFTAGRGPQFKDVLIDLSGAVITCTLCVLVMVIRQVRCRRAALTAKDKKRSEHQKKPLKGVKE